MHLFALVYFQSLSLVVVRDVIPQIAVITAIVAIAAIAAITAIAPIAAYCGFSVHPKIMAILHI